MGVLEGSEGDKSS